MAFLAVFGKIAKSQSKRIQNKKNRSAEEKPQNKTMNRII